MNPDLLAYAADSLDAPARIEFERLLRDDPELRRQLAAVRRRLAVFDDEPVAPPAGLAENTLAFIARKTAVETPRPLLARPWWRRVDVLVAASIGVVALLLMLPAVQHLRGLSLQKECANNLRDLWAGLNAYQTQRHTLPDVASAPRPAAGMVIPMLRDAGVLPATLVACCPAALDPASATGAASLTHLTLHDFASMPAADFAKAAPGLLPGFAYSLGFRDEAGLHGPKTRLPDVAAAQLPLLADAPPLPAHSAANSPQPFRPRPKRPLHRRPRRLQNASHRRTPGRRHLPQSGKSGGRRARRSRHRLGQRRRHAVTTSSPESICY